MATARETSYLGKVRLLLLLLVLGTPCVVAQEDKSKLRTWTSSIGTKIEAELVSTTGDAGDPENKSWANADGAAQQTLEG